jgi:hypothetical protein
MDAVAVTMSLGEEASAGARLRSLLAVLYEPPGDVDTAVRRLRALPQFQPASLRFTYYLLSMHQTDTAFMDVMNDIQRAFFAFFVLYLDARGAITHTGIMQLCQDLGFTSLSRAGAILMQWRMSRFLVTDALQSGRRGRRYLPNPDVVAAFRRSFAKTIESIAVIEPAALAVVRLLDGRDTFKAFVVSLGDDLIGSIKGGQRNEISLFDQRNVGLAILNRLAVSAPDGRTYPAEGPVPLSINALANEFRVSRTHVRKLIGDAEARGLMRRDASGTAIILQAPLREALADYQAAAFLTYMKAMIAALAASAEPSG